MEKKRLHCLLARVSGGAAVARYLHCDKSTAGFGGVRCGMYLLFKQARNPLTPPLSCSLSLLARYLP